jgi:hypothetical protein
VEKNDGLERLCKIYLNLNDDEKKKLIKLGDELLKSQKQFKDELVILTSKNVNTELKID